MHTNDRRQNKPRRERSSAKVPDSERAAIRAIFMHGAESYRLAEAARLLHVSPAALKREAMRDHRDEYRSGGTWRFTWRQVACIAFRTWSLAQIQHALGRNAAKVLPPLLALRSVTLRLPAFIVCALETLASGDGETIDAFLHRELMDFAGTWAEKMERVHAGFRRAYLFPGRES